MDAVHKQRNSLARKKNYSFSKYLLSFYYVPSNIISTVKYSSKQTKVPFFMLTFWWKETVYKRSEYTKCSIIVSTTEKSKTREGARVVSGIRLVGTILNKEIRKRSWRKKYFINNLS